MTTTTTVREFSSPAERLFEVVADVARYPEFIPYCASVHLSNQREEGEGRWSFRASLTMRHPRLKISHMFVSDVLCDRGALTVVSTSDRGIVKHLRSEWRFEPMAQGARVHHEMSYELRPFGLRALVSGLSDLMTGKMVEAFERRMRALETL